MILKRELLEALELETLAPYAIRARESRGRKYPLEESAVRTCYQRDYDRIVHGAPLGHKLGAQSWNPESQIDDVAVLQLLGDPHRDNLSGQPITCHASRLSDSVKIQTAILTGSPSCEKLRRGWEGATGADGFGCGSPD